MTSLTPSMARLVQQLSRLPGIGEKTAGRLAFWILRADREYAQALEYVARAEWRVRALSPDAPRPHTCLVEKHHSRKHGASAYYGQKKAQGSGIRG